MDWIDHITKYRNFDLAKTGIEPGVAGWQPFALLSELYPLILAVALHNLFSITQS